MSEDKIAQKKLVLVCGLVYDPRELSEVTTTIPEVIACTKGVVRNLACSIAMNLDCTML
jgi:hypothetical protein